MVNKPLIKPYFGGVGSSLEGVGRQSLHYRVSIFTLGLSLSTVTAAGCWYVPSRERENISHQMGKFGKSSTHSGGVTIYIYIYLYLNTYPKQGPFPILIEVVSVLGKYIYIYIKVIILYCIHQNNWMGPYQRTPKQVTRAIKYSGLGVRSVGRIEDFLDYISPQEPSAPLTETPFSLPNLWTLLSLISLLLFEVFGCLLFCFLRAGHWSARESLTLFYGEKCRFLSISVCRLFTFYPLYPFFSLKSSDVCFFGFWGPDTEAHGCSGALRKALEPKTRKPH